MSDDQVDSNDLNDAEIDSLLAGNSSDSREIPMSTEEPAAPTAPWAEDTFKANGKEIKGTRDQILQWASMGHNYPQKAQEWNQTKAQLADYQKRETEFKTFEQKLAPYREVDDYAAKNPDWWNHVQETYKQKLAGAQGNSDVQRIKQELMQELAPVKEFMQGQMSKEQSQRIEKEDTQLASEVQSIQKQYPNLDFATPDENGESLEMKVLKHAMEIGLDGSKPGHFRAAFRDYRHDELVGKAREQGKELASKEIQKRTKLGILGESPKPTKGLRVAENVRDKSYNDLVQEALSELKTS